MQVLTAQETARLLPFPALVDALRLGLREYARGEIQSPERLVLPLPAGGVMLSMPATAADLAAHKLVNVCPANRERGLPTIQGQVTAFDSRTGTPLFMLDAPTVTARRTAAVSLLGIRELHGQPREVVIVGTGTQAQGHAQGMAAVFPRARILVKGTTLERAQAFCAQVGGHLFPTLDIPESADVVITVTSSKTPVYDLPARAGRLLVAVGAFTPDAAEIAPDTVRASRLIVDDPTGARHEAGDLLQAGVDWDGVTALTQELEQPRTAQLQTAQSHTAQLQTAQPTLLKTVGCAAWDLVACRVAQAELQRASNAR